MPDQIWIVEKACQYDGCERQVLEVYTDEAKARARGAELEAELKDDDVNEVNVFAAEIKG